MMPVRTVSRLYPEILHHLRTSRGYSVSQLAFFCDASEAMVRYLESGERMPSADLVERLAEVLEVEPALLTGDGIIPSHQEQVEILKGKLSEEKKYVSDKKGLVWLLARRHFRHLVQHHSDEISAVAKSADFLFAGPRAPFQEFCRVISRRLYYLSKEVGWRRLKGGGWTHDQFYGEVGRDGERIKNGRT